MHSPSASSIPDRALTPEEIFMLLDKSTSGFPIPENVLSDVNPYEYLPSNLPDGFWYLIRSKQNEGTKFGFWRIKGEACKIFSNADITGWRTTLAFFEGQAHHEHLTDWVMQEYWITQNAPGENSKFKEAKSLCRVFLSADFPKREKVQQKASETHNHVTESSVFDAADNGSSSKTKVDQDAEIRILALAETSPNNIVEMPPEADEVLEGDYLELNDLQIPMSPSSSSDNSSCLTMSSDEYFDRDALLKDLESDSNPELGPKYEGCKFSVSASLRPDELVMFPASPGSFVVEGSHPPAEEKEIRQTDLSSHSVAGKCTSSVEKAAQITTSNQRAECRDEGPSCYPSDACTSSSSHSGSQDGKGRDDGKGRKRRFKNKYLCFMPFHFLF